MSIDENTQIITSKDAAIGEALGDVDVDISVVLGRANMPIHQLLKMGRGAVIELDSGVDDLAWILANNKVIARGEIVVTGEHVGISVVETMDGFRD
ncbi:MAG: FliM/FliN family flagellar motor switch protein [Minwuia sp.]|uniref:FliM/FliN family flagellar motor switch protein n=1 Tax=Minwuia sp. TaxID=2493630 RepID=UPI003A8A24E3